jgi:hypothetical protein
LAGTVAAGCGDGGGTPTIDPAKIEGLRVEQMKVADEASKRFTKALIDAGNVLSAEQRQAFFKAWNEHKGWWRG